MGKSANEVTLMEVRTVPRKLRQSTLFLHRAQESSAEKDIQVRREENVSDDMDVECCGSQGRKKRKAKGKATPQPKPAKKYGGESESTNIANRAAAHDGSGQGSDAHNAFTKFHKIYTKGKGCLNGMIGNQDLPVLRSMKSPQKARERNTTPKKARTNSSAEGFTMTSTSPLPTEEKIKYISDLRLEAKLSAEENSRIFAGKQVHPFFLSRKSCKVLRETTETETNSCTHAKNNSSECLRPIHVFELDQDGTSDLDWSRWIFLERSFFKCNHAHEMIDYVDHGSFTDFDKYLKASCTSSTSSLANGVARGHPAGNSSPHAVLTDEIVEHEMGHISVFSNQVGHSEYFSEEKKRSLLWIRNQGFISWNKDVLWTKKYQPERATEVCGNSKSVKYLSEWLHLWHAKALQCREFANGGMKNTSDSIDHDYYEIDCDLNKLSQGVKLKNVLLITGPTGSGKSASIYACAKEQGFNVIEVNTSDWRTGALVKQKFGEAVESHSVKRLNENEASPSKEHKSDSLNHHMSQESDNGVELINVVVEDGTYNSIDMSAIGPCARSKLPRDGIQLTTLVLFEDVDIAFTEDRGFISAIQHLAKTAKLPIILTTNSNQSILPDSLERAEIYFSRPSLKDLLGHVIEICTAEKANIEPSLIPSFVEYFHGDIRKTIMHLQFLCQSTACMKDKKFQENYVPQVFDLDVAHRLLMKLFPWGFASELSELIELELNKTLNLQEEYTTLIEVNEEKHLCESRQHGFQMHLNEDCLAAKKDAMLKRNTSHYYDSFEAEIETKDLSNSSGSPINFSRRNDHRKSDYVLSLSGDDEMYDFESQIQVSENNYQIQESCRVIDLSCVPKSSFVPETRIDDEKGESCRSVSYVPFGDMITTISSGNNKLLENLTTVEVESYDECSSRLHIDPHNMVSSYDINDDTIHNEDVGDSHTEHLEGATSRWQLMDECSQMNFNRHKPIQRNAVCKKKNFVQEAWACLRESHHDLGKYVTSKQKYAPQFLKVTFGISNLISEADILLPDSCLAQNDSAEPSTIPSEGSDAFQWYNEQLHMTSTFFDHGLSLYAKEVIAAVSSMDQTCLVDSELEMMTYRTDMIKIRKLVAQGSGISELWPRETSDSELRSCIPSEREGNSARLDIIRSIVPLRSFLAVKGEALNEYLSCLTAISRSETSCLSVGVDKEKRRGRRFGRHYLSGEHLLSLEDISLLDRFPFGSRQGDA